MLLKNSNSDSKKPSITYTIRTARTVFGIKNKLQSTSVKAVSNDPGYPKIKHISALTDIIRTDENKLVDIILAFSALTSWEQSKITSSKMLITILLILQSFPSLSLSSADSVQLLLIALRDRWSGGDQFISHFSVILNQRMNFLLDYPNYADHFNMSKMSTNGKSLPKIDDNTVFTVLSRLLSALNRLIALINIPIKYQIGSKRLTNGEIETYNTSLYALFDEANCIFVASWGLLSHIYEQKAIYSVTATSVMREQFDEEFIALRAIYCHLVKAAATNECNNGDNCNPNQHNQEKLLPPSSDLSRFPDVNPLAERYPITTSATKTTFERQHVSHINTINNGVVSSNSTIFPLQLDQIELSSAVADNLLTF